MALPEVRQFKVVGRSDLADGILGLSLGPADGAPMFPFLPGQWVMLHLKAADGSFLGKSAYSIASAPQESAEAIQLAIRVRQGFSALLQKLEIGEEVGVQGPFGVFTPRSPETPLIMLAGGIGVTPFRSIIRAHAASGRRITLLYSNRERSGMAYEQELRDLATRYPSFKPVFALTGETPESWDGLCGRIGSDILSRELVPGAEYFACGPKEFVRDMKTALAAQGVDIATKFKQEIF